MRRLPLCAPAPLPLRRAALTVRGPCSQAACFSICQHWLEVAKGYSPRIGPKYVLYAVVTARCLVVALLLLAAVHGLFVDELQLIQQLFYHLLEVTRLWKLGDPALAVVLRDHARKLYTCFVLVSQLLGQSEAWPKLHDLLHIAQDVAWLGGADEYDTGSHFARFSCARVVVSAGVLCFCSGFRVLAYDYKAASKTCFFAQGFFCLRFAESAS